MTSSKSPTRSALAGILVLALGAPALALATDPPRQPETAPAADGAARTYPVSGVTITWDLEAQRFRPPSAQEAARIAREFNRMIAERFAEGPGALAPAGAALEVRTLPSGAKMVRLPVHLINASLVRVGVEGQLQNLCVDGPAQAQEALSAPATHSVEEE